MTVTELALLQLKESASFEDASFRRKLEIAKTAMEDFTGYQFDYLLQREDPRSFYVLGSWDSVQQHIEQWLPTKKNQDLLEMLKDSVEVLWLHHVAIEKSTIPFMAPVMAIGQFPVDTGGKKSLASAFETVREKTSSAGVFLVGDWILDTAGSQETLAVFSSPKEDLSQGSDLHGEIAAQLRAVSEKSNVVHVERLLL